MTRPRAACGLAVLTAAAVWVQAQAPAPAPSASFHLSILGREIGREEIRVSVDAAVRRVESAVTWRDRGQDRTLAATLETSLDGSPRRLTVKGQRVREGRVDVDVAVTAASVEVRDAVAGSGAGGAAAAIRRDARPFFPVEGPSPAGVHEHLIRYWRSNRRPPEIAAAPAGLVRVRSRAEETLDIGGRGVAVERLSIDGPVFGRETAWVEPGGSLAALATWAGGLPLLTIRDGYESRADRFIEEAIRDRLADADRLTQLTPPEHSDGVVLIGATVVPGGRRPPVADATVVVRNGRIASIGPSSRIRPPAGLPTLDVRGLTIVPGLWDLHGSFSQVELSPLYLAAGITAVRSVNADAALAAALRTAVAENALMVPRLLPAGFLDAAGPDGVGVAGAGTPEEGRQSVRRLRGDGVRELQLGDLLTGPVMRAITQEANRTLMRVASGLPDGVTALQAVEDGVDQLAFSPAVVSPADAAALFAAMARRQTVWEPRLAWTELLASTAPLPTAHPMMGRAPAGLLRRFTGLVAPGGAAPAAGAGASKVGAARAAGVRLVAGSGPGIPALQVLRELELFVAAGVTPADALQLATSLAAQAMKLDDAGIIESGKRADLLVVAGNPLENISSLRAARWVVAGGKLYDCTKLWQAAGWN